MKGSRPDREAKATLRWLPETQMKRNKQNPSALITPRTVKVHLTLDPMKIPQITDSGRKSCPPRYGRRRSHSGCPRYVLPPSICRSFPHPIPSLLGMVSCFWIDGFHPTCGGQDVRRDGAKYVELFSPDSCSVQFSADHPDTLLYVHVPVGEEAHQAGGRLHRGHAPEQVCYHRGGASLCIGGSATDHS